MRRLMGAQRSSLLILLGVMALLLFALWLFAVYNPADHSFFPRCMFYGLTGLHCPGCGTQRAIHELVNGDLATAFFMNPLALLALPVLAYAGLSTARYHVSGKRLPRVYVQARWIWLLVFVVIAFWMLRNIPIYPFLWFAPNW